MILYRQGDKVGIVKGGNNKRVVWVSWKHREHYSASFARMGEIGATAKVTIFRDVTYDVEKLLHALVEGYKSVNNALIFKDSSIELSNPNFDPKDSRSSEFIEEFKDKNGDRCDFWTFQEIFLPRDRNRRLNLSIMSTRLTDSDFEDEDLDQEEHSKFLRDCHPDDRQQTIPPKQKYSKVISSKNTQTSSNTNSSTGSVGVKRSHDGRILDQTPLQKVAGPSQFPESDCVYVQETLDQGISSSQNPSRTLNPKLKYSKILNKKKLIFDSTTVQLKVTSCDNVEESLDQSTKGQNLDRETIASNPKLKYSKILNKQKLVSDLTTVQSKVTSGNNVEESLDQSTKGQNVDRESRAFNPKLKYSKTFNKKSRFWVQLFNKKYLPFKFMLSRGHSWVRSPAKVQVAIKFQIN